MGAFAIEIEILFSFCFGYGGRFCLTEHGPGCSNRQTSQSETFLEESPSSTLYVVHVVSSHY
jgi:hypothetical protein